MAPIIFQGRKFTLHGDRNKFKPIGLEHKLGIHGSPTCVMEFDGATGWLVGEENRGLACMFVRRMMIDMKTRLMGARAIAMATAASADIAIASDDAEIAKQAHARDALLAKPCER